jgi:hypothetical protein
VAPALSEERPIPEDRGAAGGGRPPGSSSRRRRRGRGRGSRGGAAPAPDATALAVPAAPTPRPPRDTSAARGAERGRRRGGGGDRGRRSPQRPQSQPQAQSERELEITDEKIFQRLLDAGLDLEQEAVLQAFLYFAGEPAARRVATQLEEIGYLTFVDPSPPTRWLLEAVSRAVPTPEHVAAMGDTLRAAAHANNGIYDGWWASEPPEDEDQPATLPDPEPAEV